MGVRALLKKTVALMPAAALAFAACAAPLPQTEGTGAPAPQFALTSVTGRTERLVDFRGRVIVLELWAVWSEACEDAIPFFQGLQGRYNRRYFEVVGVNEDEEREAVTQYARAHHMNYTVLADPSRRLLGELGVDSMPTTLVVDEHGLIRGRWTGYNSKNAAEIEATVKALLGARAEAPVQSP